MKRVMLVIDINKSNEIIGVWCVYRVQRELFAN